jgi:hypothetical protein
VPGTPVTVQFSAQPKIPEQAWIGLIPSRIPHGDEVVNDANDVDYHYLEGRTQGDLTFHARLSRATTTCASTTPSGTAGRLPPPASPSPAR